MNPRSIYQFLRFVLGLILIGSMALVDARPAYAGLRCYVKANASGSGDGLSWVNAFKDLQLALGPSSCTEVWVAKGIYKPTNNKDRTISFVLKSGVALYGGFAGTETSLLDRRHWAANPTILSGQIGAVEDSDNSYHVVLADGTDGTAILDGFTVTGGYAANGFGGGGMWNLNSGATLANLIFSGNLASAGGGMYNQNSSPTLRNVTFDSNSTDSPGNGAGMYNENSNPYLREVTFSNNVTGSPGNGGGMYNNTSNPTLVNVTFSGNSAPNGGGMFNYQSSPGLMNVTFSGNTVTGNGGGMYNFTSGNAIVTNSILYGDAGGEIFNDGGTATVTFSIVQGGYPGAGNLIGNPLLLPLGNYGTFWDTKTMPLGFGSPAIDSGTNVDCPANDQRAVFRPQDGDGNGTVACDMGATESSFLTATFRSVGAQDGWVLESTETSGVGGAMDARQATIALGDDAYDRQGLSILSFKTAGLPDNAVIASAILKIKQAGVVGKPNPFTTHGNVLVDVRKGAFSNNAALQIQDFQAAANKKGAMVILNNPVNGWYSGTMGAANFTYINKRGLTQIRLRFAKDDDDNQTLNYIKFYSGNSTLANRPQLIIQYYVP